MATERFAQWVTQTKELTAIAEPHSNDWYIGKALVWALLTIAIAIHEAAEVKGRK